MNHRRNKTHNGCKLLIPVLDAIAPVKNGKSAEPACPNPAIQPMDPTSGFSSPSHANNHEITCEEPTRKDAYCMIHSDRIHGSQNYTNYRDRYASANERRDQPYYQLQPNCEDGVNE
jgi:hypothetical protein